MILPNITLLWIMALTFCDFGDWMLWTNERTNQRYHLALPPWTALWPLKIGNLDFLAGYVDILIGTVWTGQQIEHGKIITFRLSKRPRVRKAKCFVIDAFCHASGGLPRAHRSPFLQ